MFVLILMIIVYKCETRVEFNVSVTILTQLNSRDKPGSILPDNAQ